MGNGETAVGTDRQCTARPGNDCVDADTDMDNIGVGTRLSGVIFRF